MDDLWAGLTAALLVVLTDFQPAESMDGHKVDLTDERRAACKVSQLAEWTEVHLMNSQCADLKRVAQLAKTTAELTDERRAAWKVSK
jgi:hypothetical protein